MASMHLGSFPVTFSVPAVASHGRAKKCAKSYHASCHVPKASWYKSEKIQNEYPIVRHEKQHNLKHDYRCIGAASTSKEFSRSYVVNAAPGESLESEPSRKSLWTTTIDFLYAFYKFSRPYAMVATAVNIASVSLLAIDNLSDISPTFFIGLLKAMSVIYPITLYGMGINHIADYEIDKINKPYLPMASGEFSLRTIVIITASCLISSFGIGWIIGSLPLILVISSHFVLASAYSINLPLLRWKRSSVLTTINFIIDRGIMCQLGLFLHMKAYVFKRPIIYPRSLFFGIVSTIIFSIVVALFKDIPDVEGDEKFGIRNMTVLLGQKRVFWICVSILEMAYVAAILFVGATSSYLWSKLTTGLGHALLATILWYRARSVDVKNKVDTQSFYMFIWKLLYAEWFIVPFVR